MHPRGRRKCNHCKEFFIAEARNRHHQRYCPKPACRRASKAASQRRWENRPENCDYNRSAEKAKKVRAWQAANPGYWKKRRKRSTVLPEVLAREGAPQQEVTVQDGEPVLPDLWHGQSPLVVGLIAQMTGYVLPEDIAGVAHQLVVRGQALMGRNYEDRKTNLKSPAAAANA